MLKAKQKNTNFLFDNVNGQFDFSNVILKSVDDKDYYQRKWLIFEISYFCPMFDPDYYTFCVKWYKSLRHDITLAHTLLKFGWIFFSLFFITFVRLKLQIEMCESNSLNEQVFFDLLLWIIDCVYVVMVTSTCLNGYNFICSLVAIIIDFKKCFEFSRSFNKIEKSMMDNSFFFFCSPFFY